MGNVGLDKNMMEEGQMKHWIGEMQTLRINFDLLICKTKHVVRPN